MANGWSVSGKRIEVGPAFPAGKLVMDGELVTKLKSKGDFPVVIAGRGYTFKRKPGWPTPVQELISPAGTTVPFSKTHTAQILAPADAACATHPDARAAIVCARCGSFACSACSEADGTHCAACIAPMIAAHQRQQGDLVLMAPAFIFMVSGGLLGGLIGGGAAALAVAVARRLDSKVTKWVAALAIYLVAALLFVIAVGVLRHNLDHK